MNGREGIDLIDLKRPFRIKARACSADIIENRPGRERPELPAVNLGMQGSEACPAPNGSAGACRFLLMVTMASTHFSLNRRRGPLGVPCREAGLPVACRWQCHVSMHSARWGPAAHVLYPASAPTANSHMRPPPRTAKNTKM